MKNDENITPGLNIARVNCKPKIKSVVVIPPESSLNKNNKHMLPTSVEMRNDNTKTSSNESETPDGASNTISHKTKCHARNKMADTTMRQLTITDRLKDVNFTIPQVPFTERNILNIAEEMNKKKQLKNNMRENRQHERQETITQDIDQNEKEIENTTQRRYMSYFEHSTGEIVYVEAPPSPLTFSKTLNKFWPTIVERVWKDNKYFVQLYTQVRQSALPNYLDIRMPVPSKLKIQNWRKELINYQDVMLVDMLAFGWPVDYTATKIPTPTYVNHAKDTDATIHIDKYIQKELQYNALLGPFEEYPFTPWYQVSPMMTRDKHESNDKRIIVDLSFPEGRGVNSGIKKGWYQGEQVHFSLPSITDLAQLVVDEGTGCYMWSIDLARAYRQIRTCPLSTPLLGITHKGKFYIDVCPPFGCRTSSYICARTTAAVVWILNQKGIKSLCYLDDFVGVAKSMDQAISDYKAALELLEYLGLETSPNKCVPPTQILTWLGFQLDSVKMSIHLPKQKLEDILEEAKCWFNYEKVSKKQLQKLVGKLKHVSKCVPHADRFFARILLQMRSTPDKGKHTFEKELLKDILWFINFAEMYNGVCLLPTKPQKEWVIESDATLKAGGAWSKEKFFSSEFPLSITNSTLSINQLEALTVIHALYHLLPNDPHNHVIILNTDNQATQSVLSTGKGRDPFLTACSRQLWLIAAINSTDIVIKYKPGETLVLADALSRSEQLESFKKKAKIMCKDKNLKKIDVNIDVNILTCSI